MIKTALIKIKRIYDKPSQDDGIRILVDRLWPRGLKKENAKIDMWIRDIAPSTELRKWFNHQSSKWQEFKQRYFKELEKKNHLIETLLKKEKEKGTITLLYAARDEKYNNAVALKEYLEMVKHRLTG